MDTLREITIKKAGKHSLSYESTDWDTEIEVDVDTVDLRLPWEEMKDSKKLKIVCPFCGQDNKKSICKHNLDGYVSLRYVSRTGVYSWDHKGKCHYSGVEYNIPRGSATFRGLKK